MSMAFPIAFAAVAGLVLGLGYFAALGRSIARFTAGGAVEAALLTALRLAAAAAGLALAARWGALPLLAAFAGFLAARTLALAAARRAC